MKNYTLNLNGQEALSASIKEVAFHPSTIRPAAWFDVAEDSASGFETGQLAAIEIGARYTVSQNPIIITLQPEWFDVEEVE